MPKKAPANLTVHTRVKEALKSLNLDQTTVAQKLEVTQTMVSMALRGTNQKTFLRLLTLLKNEYNLDFNESSAGSDDIEMIKTELRELNERMGEVLRGIEELKEMMKK
jgi:transcriptional regulator with XRE-family HTH domain